MPQIYDDPYILVPTQLDDKPRGKPTQQWWDEPISESPSIFSFHEDTGESAVGKATLAPLNTGGADWWEYAKSQIGIDYVFGSWNAAGQEGGAGEAFDCSGFTGAVLEQAGYKSIPHSAAQQATMFNHLKKDQMKPGDLVFYSYGRLGPGGIDHVAIYIGNGKQIAASSGEDQVTIQAVDWDNFQYGGDTKLSGKPGTSTGRAPGKGQGGMASKTVYPDLTLVPASMGSEQVANLADVTHTVFRDMQNEAGVKGKNTPAFSGSQAEIKSQLYRGFMDAGRPDLARMVKTKDFDTWISAESGWRTDVVSQYYSGHGRNAGLFQFALLDRDWVWSDVNRSDWSYQATPYQQARAVVANFSLTPSDIKTYAEQIRNGEYGGWG